MLERQVLHKTKAGELIEIRLPLFCAQLIDSDGDFFTAALLLRYYFLDLTL